MPTRQQKRARSRAPVRQKRKGTVAFVAVLTAIMLAGGAGVFLLRAGRPTTPQRGAIVGEHWHARYEIQLCGKLLAPYPFVEGEIHTHGDGQVHIHPNSQFFAGDNANLGAFFRTVETQLSVNAAGKRVFVLPDGTSYTDGDTCEGSDEPHELVVLVNGDPVEGDPSDVVMKEGDEIVVRFGPEFEQGGDVIPNPLQPLGQTEPADPDAGDEAGEGSGSGGTDEQTSGDDDTGSAP